MNYKKWEPVLFKELSSHMKTVPIHNLGSDIHHILRVWEISESLGVRFNSDMEILIAAVFFHDLGRHYGKEKHGKLSSEIAGPILEKINFPHKKRKTVLEAIRFHEYFYPDKSRKSIEAKILSDADRIDSLGVIGIMRHLFKYYANGTSIPDILEMIDKRWESIVLEPCREAAHKEYAVIRSYFEALNEKQSKSLKI